LKKDDAHEERKTTKKVRDFAYADNTDESGDENIAGLNIDVPKKKF